MQSTSNRRNSSVELLRIMSMLLIVIFHFHARLENFYVISNDMLNHPGILNDLFLNSLGYLGVPCFIFISGFYGIKFRFNRLREMIVTCFIYACVSFCGLWLFYNVCQYKNLIGFLNEWWFMTAYICLYLLAPGIEYLFVAFSQKQILTIIILFFCIIFTGCIPGIMGAGSLPRMISIYMFARYIGLYLPYRLNRNAGLICLGLLILRVVLILFSYYSHHLGLMTIINAYDNPMNTLTVCAIFLVFNRIKFKSKIINRLAIGSLSVYLLSESNLGKVLFEPFFVKEYVEMKFVNYLMASVSIYLIIVIIDEFRRLLTNHFVLKRVSR